jgi:hypothetical protein
MRLATRVLPTLHSLLAIPAVALVGCGTEDRENDRMNRLADRYVEA